MEKELIAIKSYGSISPLGSEEGEIWDRYNDDTTCITSAQFGENTYAVGKLTETSEEKVKQLIKKDSEYKRHDRTALLSIIAANTAFENSGWKEKALTEEIGINIGSSRGATGLFEKYHKQFLTDPKHEIPIITSPLTTLGNISSAVADSLSINGPIINHSVTCSTAMQSIFNAIAWIKSGMADKFLAGGSEAPLTEFTIAQMKALKIYSRDTDNKYPCRPLSSEENRTNTLVLGEGACIFAIEKCNNNEIRTNKPIAIIESIGYSYKKPPSLTGVSDKGEVIEQSMRKAMKNMLTKQSIDLVIMHAPGTIQGDMSEIDAIKRIFGADIPNLTTNKWKIGHTFAASAALSLELAILCMKHNRVIEVPYSNIIHNNKREIKKIMVNSTGFGGNSSSIIISLPELFE